LISNHDFPIGFKHKLILSIYLLINSSDINDSLQSGKLWIFICSEYFLEISCEIHMINLIKIIEKEAYHEFTYCKTQNVISDYMTQEDNTNNVDQL